MSINVGAPVLLTDLLAKPSSRRLNERDLELTELVAKIAEAENAELAYPWDFGDEKPLTARAAAVRAIRRSGLEAEVFVSAKDGKLWFAQQKLSARGRPKV